MKILSSGIVGLVLVALCPAAENTSGVTITPQPRIRLMPTAQGPTARVESLSPLKPAAGPMMMSKIVVSAPTVPLGPARPAQPEPPQFTVQGGGPLAKGKIGSATYEAGLWPWNEIFVDAAMFEDQKTRADFQMLRIRW